MRSHTSFFLYKLESLFVVIPDIGNRESLLTVIPDIFYRESILIVLRMDTRRQPRV